jgi:hypothetical protein
MTSTSSIKLDPKASLLEENASFRSAKNAAASRLIICRIAHRFFMMTFGLWGNFPEKKIFLGDA